MRAKLLALSVFMVCSPLAGGAVAQGGGGVPKPCERGGAQPGPDYERDTRAEWPKEAQRLKSNEQLVSRRQDRLRLTLDSGKTVDLVDCPFGQSGYWYLYDQVDQAGGFYVIRTLSLEDFSYVFVMRRTGQLFTAYGTPVWASDKSRFLTVACSLQPQRGSLTIRALSAEGLSTEAEIALPCESESCSARWDHASWISVTCVPREEPGKRGTEFVLMRGNDGVWKRFGR
jgi:hypothetical protein